MDFRLSSCGTLAAPPRSSLRRALSGLVLAGVVGGGWLALAQREAASPASRDAARGAAAAAFAKLPLRFEANRGQSSPAVRFLARGAGYTLFLTPREAVVSLTRSDGRGAVLRTRLLGASPQPRLRALDRLPGSSNYLLGNDRARWRTGVPGYGEVRYGGAYPGIDLVYHGRQGALEYDFDVAPGADPGRIALGFRGARRLTVDRGGDLLISTAAGAIRQRRPVLYQQIGGRRRPVTGRYVLQGRDRVGFRVGAYDTTRTLVIDPVLAYSTYLGAGASDVAAGLAVGADGSLYVTGYTSSDDFPTTAGALARQRNQGAGCATPPFCATDTFVTKLSADGSRFVYSTYLGGSGADTADGIAVDVTGRALVTGVAGAESVDFPTSANAFQRAHSPAPPPPVPGDPPPPVEPDAFLSVLRPDGASLAYSTFLGGTGDDGGAQVAVTAGRAYVTGQTCSDDFPVVLATPTPRAFGGICDAFVSELNPDATTARATLVASTYLGGGDFDRGSGVAVDATGVVVVGSTSSPDFPTVGAFRSAPAGDPAAPAPDAFVTRLRRNLTAPLYSTYFGGTDFDLATGVALDASGRAYVSGATASTDLPTRNPFQRSAGGNGDAFVAKFDTGRAGDASLAWASYLGGGLSELAGDIGVDAAGGAFVAGTTSSDDFPTVRPIERRAADQDAFVARVQPDGGGLSFASHLGGGGPELDIASTALAIDRATGSAYVAVPTDSTDVPTRNALQASAPSLGNGDREDSMIAKISPDAAGAPIVAGISPRGGPSLTTVVVRGSGFSGATAVRFGAVAAASFAVTSDGEITAVSPSQPVGAVPVTVTTPGGSSAPNPIATFHSAEGRFDAAAPLAVGNRAGSTATQLADGSVLVVGGCCDPANSQKFASAELYQPLTGAWSPAGSLRFPRTGHAATILQDGRVLVAGGCCEVAGNGEQLAVRTAEIYDPATRTWTPAGDLSIELAVPAPSGQPPRRVRAGLSEGHTATLLPGGKVLVAGGSAIRPSVTLSSGETVPSADIAAVDAAELYDPASGTWSGAGSLGQARTRHTATLLPGGKVLVAGGAAASADPQRPGVSAGPLNSSELYDPATDGWRGTGSTMLVARQRHTATLLADGRVLVAGGRDQGRSSSVAETYDPAISDWTATGDMQVRRDGHAAVRLASGKVLLVGGQSGLSTHETAELYDPQTRRFSPEGVMNAYRGGTGQPPFAFPLPNGSVLVGGGDRARSAELYTPPSPLPVPGPAPDLGPPAGLPAPPGGAPSSGAAAGPIARSTAKMALARATINRRLRVLDVLAPITARASGRVRVTLRSAGRSLRFTAAIDSANARIRFRRRIPAAQARLGTGILTIAYPGDADTRPQTVRLRAARRPAALRLGRPRIVDGRLRASGTVTRRARGVVRVQLEYDHLGVTRLLRLRAPIRRGRWSLNQRLSDAALAEIAGRTGTVHSYTLFTGYLPGRVRGEMRSFGVLAER